MLNAAAFNKEGVLFYWDLKGWKHEKGKNVCNQEAVEEKGKIQLRILSALTTAVASPRAKSN
ncbi:Uncharacterised protein [uncultured archaeon]|nr:Uncharacterised protein [uncultured archaeon]